MPFDPAKDPDRPPRFSGLLRRSYRVVRVGVTIAILICAALALVGIWNHYLTGPWTRDGQIEADVVFMAPEVSGRITKLYVSENQFVKRGAPLYDIDRSDYQIAVASAEATVQAKAADLRLKQIQAHRRSELTNLSTSLEEQQTYTSNAQIAQAAYDSALAQLSQARVNLARTQVVSPVNGVISNLLLREGDYATSGLRNLSVVDADSYRVVGYFEETKLAGIPIGAPAVALLEGFRQPIRGHVDSIAPGINITNRDPGTLGLATVNPIFTWVRLAQRIPVRIHIDQVPPGMRLAVGMTCTVTVGETAYPGSLHGWISRQANLK